MLSRFQLFAIPWAVARHAYLTMGFPKQKYWSGLPFPSPCISLNELLSWLENKEVGKCLNKGETLEVR